MTKLTDSQIASYARGAGFTPDQVPTMVAIALAESGGDTNAHNPSGAEGLWQVMWSLHGFTGNPYDPATNASAAKKVFDSQGYHAWTTYDTGVYRAFLGRAEAASGGSSGGNNGSSSPGTVDNGNLSSSVNKATSSSTWLRIGEFALGALLIIFAILRLTGGDKIIISGAKTAAEAAAL